ncbi:MAG: CerR family C-terminal domain-containing protein [Alphaproteobacteria bacterium]|nr:CerR family C-terminal domain-containing protein [Alphaproteobacteria bacterium]
MKSDTKEKIVKTAIYEFAVKGFEPTATRDILAKAKANVAAISYYFGNKNGLYAEVLKRILVRLNEKFSDEMTEYESELALRPCPEKSEILLKRFIRGFVELFCSDKLTTAMCMIFVREYVEPSACFKSLFQSLNTQYRQIFVDLLVDANAGKMSYKEAVLQVVMLFSSIFMLVSRKKIILDAMQWKEYSSNSIDEILTVFYRGLFRK